MGSNRHEADRINGVVRCETKAMAWPYAFHVDWQDLHEPFTGRPSPIRRPVLRTQGHRLDPMGQATVAIEPQADDASIRMAVRHLVDRCRRLEARDSACRNAGRNGPGPGTPWAFRMHPVALAMLSHLSSEEIALPTETPARLTPYVPVPPPRTKGMYQSGYAVHDRILYNALSISHRRQDATPLFTEIVVKGRRPGISKRDITPEEMDRGPIKIQPALVLPIGMPRTIVQSMPGLRINEIVEGLQDDDLLIVDAAILPDGRTIVRLEEAATYSPVPAGLDCSWQRIIKPGCMADRSGKASE